MTNQAKAYIYAIAAVLMWSTVATAFKLTLETLDVIQMLFYACLVSALVLLTAVGFLGRLGELPVAAKSEWRITLIAGLLNPCIYYLILFEAYDRLPAQVAQPINYTWAIVLAFMSVIFLRQKIHRFDFLAAGICYSGVFLIATQGDITDFSETDPLGLALALVSTLVWAGYWVINIRDRREPIIAMSLNFLLALPVVGVLCLLFSDFAITWEGFAGAAYIGVFEMSLAFLCWSIALRNTDNAATIGNLIFLAPFLSLLLIHLVLGEQIYSTTYAGLILIISGLLLQQWFRKN